ncbi:MAG: DUF6596 domain-containing protein, partial [Actinomycetota bacterium]
RIRRERTGKEKAETLARLEARAAAEDPAGVVDDHRPAGVLRDEQLGLVFGCCHPALSVEAQLALTLRSVGGLTTGEIARAFLVPEATMAQRLVRAKRKIANAAIPFRIPEDAELLSRLGVVHQVFYLIFNEGYAASSGDELIRRDLTGEAIRLARLLASLVNDDPETHGQLALFLLIESRREARVDASGDLVLLGDQNRSLWDRGLIAEGVEALDRALAFGNPGPYQIEAAINAVHAEAAEESETDWVQIVALYRELRRHRPTPITTLNLAVAVSYADSPSAALGMLDEPELASRLDDYLYYHSTRADLLRRLGHPAAAEVYRRARTLTENEAEQRFLDGRLAELQSSSDGPT